MSLNNYTSERTIFHDQLYDFFAISCDMWENVSYAREKQDDTN